MPRGRGHGGHHGAGAWPGWVDALSSLLMVVIFVLMVLVVAQYYLANAVGSRDEALTRLNRQIAELSEVLTLERQAGAELRSTVNQLNADLQTAVRQRDGLRASLGELTAERDRLSALLAGATARAEAGETDARRLQEALDQANRLVTADKEAIELRLKEIASLQADLKALREARETLEAQIAALAEVAQQGRDRAATLESDKTRLTEELRLSEEQKRALLAELDQLRDRSKALEAEVAEAQERTALAQREIESRDIRLEELLRAADASGAALDEQRTLTASAQAEIVALDAEIQQLRGQLERLAGLLADSERQAAEQNVQIADLGRRLNAALAGRVEELQRYRSEFFGRLREVLGDRPDVRIVGDRFVFQSEVLFTSGSAVLEPAGRDAMAKFATQLKEIVAQIPEGINWVLRVDGHTDIIPIATPQFPSNWELSTARATAVVKFLIEQGLPAERLVAGGAGQFQPIDPGRSEDALRKNRRIEIKLDQR